MPAPVDLALEEVFSLAELGSRSADEASCTSSSTEGPLRAGRYARLGGRRWVRVAAATGALAATAALFALARARASEPQRRPAIGDAGESIGASGLLTALAQQMESGGGIANHIVDYPGKIKELEQDLKTAGKEMFESNAITEDDSGPLRAMLQNGTWQTWAEDDSNVDKMRAVLSIHNHLHDGNPCADDEEAHAGLCYKKCSLLLPDHPIRTSAFSCCKGYPCTLFNQKVKFRICSGFDVSGDSQGNGCPHQKGSCYVDEEMHLDRCYKKCSLLTNGEYMFRSAVETCCKLDLRESLMACMEPSNAQTDKAFAVGGGELERGVQGDAPRPVHAPMIDAAEPK